ncbi:MAG: ATP-binding protein [Bacteroidales bacterium]|nr:ATP-binding protein [Bacteroidales bacterium]
MVRKIERNIYLNRLIDSIGNGMIKIVTGVRRSGKSFLLFRLFVEWLQSQGIDDAHILKVNLEDRLNKQLRDPDVLLNHIYSHILDDGHFYVLLDEVQMVPEFEDVLNSFLDKENVDVFVTGSNAKFLSKDVITEFRGRGEEIFMQPLSFGEFMSVYEGSYELGLDEYMTFGGLPQVLSYKTEKEKSNYMKGLFRKTYITDIVDRYGVRNTTELGELLDIVASCIGSLTNLTKIANTFASVKNVRITNETMQKWLEYLCDSFLVAKAVRYDVKGRKYINTPSKFYFCDLGLRNARLNFRQTENTYLMENLIYNELIYRGYNVDVGVVVTEMKDEEGKRHKVQLEIDFVCNQGSKRIYVQSAYRLPTEAKQNQELFSLTKADDSFKKVVIVGEDQLVHRNDKGIVTMSLRDFLMDKDALDKV